MTQRQDFDLLMTAWLEAEAPVHAPHGLADDAIAEIARTERRPGWRILERWLSVQATARLTVVRPAFAFLVVIALLVLVVIVAALIGRPPHPLQLGRNGLIAFDSNGSVFVAAPDGSNPRALTTGPNDSNPTWSPDGSQIAFWRGTLSEPESLVVARPDGSDPRILATGVLLADPGSPITWTPEGRHILYTSGSNGIAFLAAVDGSGAVPFGDPATPIAWPAFSPDATSISFRSGSSDAIYLMAADGSRVRKLGDVEGAGAAYWRPAWSPDSKSILVVGGAAQNELWLVRVDGTAPSRLAAFGDYTLYWPTWSPDASAIAVDRDSGVEIVNANGSLKATISDLPVEPFPIQWAPDGTAIYAIGKGAQTVVVLDPSGAKPAVSVSAPGNVGNGSWQWLAP